MWADQDQPSSILFVGSSDSQSGCCSRGNALVYLRVDAARRLNVLIEALGPHCDVISWSFFNPIENTDPNKF